MRITKRYIPEDGKFCYCYSNVDFIVCNILQCLLLEQIRVSQQNGHRYIRWKVGSKTDRGHPGGLN
jgi:hypothetical protein